MNGNGRPAHALPVFFCMLLAIILTASGCASKSGIKRHTLYPAATSAGQAKGYSSTGPTWIYRDADIMVTVQGHRPGPDARGVEVKLDTHGYVLLAMSIKSLSDKKVIYNPAGTSLMDNSMRYGKPLDFTNLYDMATEEEKLGGLTGFAKRFYDLSVTLMPGEKIEKLLAFRPRDRKARSATLVVKGIYVGTDVVDLGFPFKLKPAEAL